MPEITVYFTDILVETKTSLEQDLYWYDAELHEMNTFKGGSLGYKYQYDSRVQKSRLLPFVQEVMIKETQQCNNKESAVATIDDYINKNDLVVSMVSDSPNSVVINVAEDDCEDFEYMLESYRIKYEVDDE